MTTIVWYHVLWQVTFSLCTSQRDSDNLRSRHVRSILLESLSPEASVKGKPISDQQATPSRAVTPLVLEAG